MLACYTNDILGMAKENSIQFEKGNMDDCFNMEVESYPVVIAEDYLPII